MDSDINVWLKHHYQSAAVSGPQSKRMKFSEVMDDATSELQSIISVSPCILSHAIREEFPDTVSKKIGKNRHTYVYGIEKSSQSLQAALKRNEVLQKQVQELEQRVAELEHTSTLAQTLDQQMTTLLHPDMASYHGPDTVDHLKRFSLDAVMTEFSSHAPDIVDLLSQLGGCNRFDDEGDSDPARIATLRSTTALCTLMKGRSVKVLGLQLLLSFMLIARATSKQV